MPFVIARAKIPQVQAVVQAIEVYPVPGISFCAISHVYVTRSLPLMPLTTILSTDISTSPGSLSYFFEKISMRMSRGTCFTLPSILSSLSNRSSSLRKRICAARPGQRTVKAAISGTSLKLRKRPPSPLLVKHSRFLNSSISKCMTSLSAGMTISLPPRTTVVGWLN